MYDEPLPGEPEEPSSRPARPPRWRLRRVRGARVVLKWYLIACGAAANLYALYLLLGEIGLRLSAS